ncbi:male-enhanced antigen 1 [Melopsittacus undulatus]|uniref:male-enhanced antigen 1 n=1 Tax=Melopsittacus undulatus TaxID=13146 RepID=UPI001469BC3B|nr:male-enhanced antigen 1 [Melopsittacus undulatus]
MAGPRSMGPERVCPEEPGPPEAPDGAAGWSGDEEEEEEEEEEGGGGYLYQPLSQEPEQGPTDGPAAEPGPGLQERLQMLRLHLPDPPADSEDEEEEEEAAAAGGAAQSSRSSIPMDAEHVELVKRTMAGVKLPSLGIPAWASQISEDQWKDVVRRTLQARRGLGASRPDWK